MIAARLDDAPRYSSATAQITVDKPSVSNKAVTEMIVSQTVHVLKVCGTVIPKYSFTSQKPPSFVREDQRTRAGRCSDLFVDVFGDAGRHSRSAVGVGSLPGNITVEIEAIVAIQD
jgi:enamine deaminase RidA (YjgF/YER057c/UK114 family)